MSLSATIDSLRRSGFRSRWTGLTLVLMAVWVAEVFVFQELTLGARGMTPEGWIATRGIRLTLDSIAVGALTVLLGRRWLVMLFLIHGAVAIGLFVYHDFFGQPLSFITLRYQSGEGAAAFEYVVALIDWRVVAVLLVILVLKTGLLSARVVLRRPNFNRFSVAMFAGVMYLAVFAAANFVVDPLNNFRQHADVGRMGSTYGYFISWLGEAWYLPQGALLQRANAVANTGTDRLSLIEPPLELGSNVVLIQVESLSAEVLQHEVDGRPVMPFLQELAQKAMSYTVRAIHTNSSADADFAALTAKVPSPDVVTYKILGYDYSNALPKIASDAGFYTVGLHGTSGAFFNRRYAFERIGFDQILFQEEFEEALGRKYSDRPIEGLDDNAVLQYSLELIGESSEVRNLHFIVTLTSHGPFKQLEPSEMQPYRNPHGLVENYINSMNYVDTSLRNYVNGLPDNTTLVIYGDHEGPDLGSASMPDGGEFVPFLIYTKGQDLSRLQQTRDDDISSNGELTLLDGIRYFWRAMCSLRPNRGDCID